MLTGPGATIGEARKLRKEMSLPEILFWQQLRQRPSGHKFRRQHLAGPYILDFACVSSKVALEIDGESHGTDHAFLHDAVRDEWLANQGYRVLRIPARQVLKDLAGAVELVAAFCTSAQPLHQPSAGPPPRAGEDL